MALNDLIDKDPNKIPRNVTIKQLGVNTIGLNWELPLNSGGISQYNVYRAYTKDLDFSNIGNTVATGYVDSGVEATREYYYSISTVYSGLPASTDLVPLNPRFTIQTGFTPPNVVISWNAPSGLISGNVISTNIASGTIAHYRFENNIFDSGLYNYSLSEVGTLRYSNTNQTLIGEGAASAGPFSSNGYITGNYQLLSGLSNLRTWSFEFIQRALVKTNNPKLLSWQNENGENYIALPSSPDSIRVGISGNIIDTPKKSSIAGNWSHIGVAYDGLDIRIYSDNILLLTTGINGYTGTVTGLYIGISASGITGAFSGYMDSLRFSNYAKTSFPTQDNYGPSGIPSTTVALYRFENNTESEVGSYPLEINGSPTFSNSIFKEGSYSVGVFSRENFLSGTALHSVLSNLGSNYTFELFCHITGLRTNMSLFSFLSSSGLEQDFRITSTSGLQWRSGSATFGLGTNVLSTGWNHIAFTFDGATRRTYVNGCFKSMAQTNLSNSILSNVSNFNLGKSYTNGSTSVPFSGFIDYFKISNIPLSGFPSENYLTYSGTSYSGVLSPVSGYRIWRTNTWDGIMNPIGTTENLSYIDSGLNTEYPYYYRVTSLF